jgi:hypothetical protein
VADLFSKTVALATFGLAIGHQNVDYELGQVGCFRMLLKGTCLAVSCSPAAAAAWLREKSGGKEIALSDVRYFLSMAMSDQLISFLTERPDSMWLAHLTAGDLLYVPAGHVVAMQVRNAEDVLGIRIGVTSAADIPLLKTFAKSPMLKWVLQHLEASSPSEFKDSGSSHAESQETPGRAAATTLPPLAPVEEDPADPAVDDPAAEDKQDTEMPAAPAGAE